MRNTITLFALAFFVSVLSAAEQKLNPNNQGYFEGDVLTPSSHFIDNGQLPRLSMSCAPYVSSGDQLYTIDPTTGALTTVMTLETGYGDLAVSSDYRLYAALFDEIYYIDVETQTTTLFGGYSSINAFFTGLAFATDNNKLYAADYYGSIVEIDLSTGDPTVIATVADNLNDLVYNPANEEFWVYGFSGNLYGVKLDGTVRLIGNTGYFTMYGMLYHEGILYGYDYYRGQFIIDQNTGVGIQSFPILGIEGAASTPCFGRCSTGGQRGCICSQRRLSKKTRPADL